MTYASGWFAHTLVNAVGVLHADPNKLTATGAAVTRSVPPAQYTFISDPPDLGYDALLDKQLAAQTLDEFIEAAKKIA